MTVRDDLIEAKKAISIPSAWAQDSGIDGVCYCAVTSICATSYRDDYQRFEAVWDALQEQVPGGRPTWEYNDDPSTTHADIMALFDRAIAASEPQS